MKDLTGRDLFKTSLAAPAVVVAAREAQGQAAPPALLAPLEDLGHQPIIDFNRRRGDEKRMDPADTVRYRKRSRDGVRR